MIRRLTALISSSATAEVEREAAMKQAASASRAAESLLDSGSAAPADKDKAALEKELKEAKEELRKANKNVESMKSQSKSLTDEYDRLLAEHGKLEKKLRIAGGGPEGDKKDD